MLKFSAALLTAALMIGQPLASLSLSGRRAPSFSLPDSRLAQHDILDYRGHWLLLDFMRTDCPHCKELSKKLEGIKARSGGKAAVLSIVLPPDNQQTVNRYIAEQRMTSPIVFDGSQVAVAYFKATPATPGFDTPHLFVIDPNGTIVRDWSQAGVEAPSFVSDIEAMIKK